LTVLKVSFDNMIISTKRAYPLMMILFWVFLLSFPWTNISAQGLRSVENNSIQPGWTGTEVIAKPVFLYPPNWRLNVASPEAGDRISVLWSEDTLLVDWTLGTGRRYKWAQCYQYLPQTTDLNQFDLFGFDIKGTAVPGEVGFELKFEDGVHQAVLRWDKLAGLTRWAERISASRKQFENSSSLDWSRIRVISLAVYARENASNDAARSGVISITPLKATAMASWPRATEREMIDPASAVSIGDKALKALISRQKSTGLLTTWTEDGSSWLYGQGLALKALSLEGKWDNGKPSGEAAEAAEKLAHFLATHQQPEGYWPRAWNSETGNINMLLEENGTVWMGDFPWAVTGLQVYYKKSRDTRVMGAIQKGLTFLTGLIEKDGRFLTTNPLTGKLSEVTSSEAYAAAIQCLLESGDTLHADLLFRYLSDHAWDSQLKFWKEATNSDRIVLFANTWMAPHLFRRRELQRGLDALTLAGKVLYTRGNGEHSGLDGIGPLSIWYEGTLSYIAAGGPGSKSLFSELNPHIHENGMISHYNENLGSMAGIWAVDWLSLDGTSWLYFTSRGSSPFDVSEGIPVGIQEVQGKPEPEKFIISGGAQKTVCITLLSPGIHDFQVRFFTLEGKLIHSQKFSSKGEKIIIRLSQREAAHWIIVQVIWNYDQQTRLIRL
jgi:hypothetical protein